MTTEYIIQVPLHIDQAIGAVRRDIPEDPRGLHCAFFLLGVMTHERRSEPVGRSAEKSASPNGGPDHRALVGLLLGLASGYLGALGQFARIITGLYYCSSRRSGIIHV